MTVLLVLLLLAAVWGGHEVVYQYKLKASDLRPEELAIIQYDSRGLSPSSSSAPTQDLQYWQAAALINNAYAKHHGHSYFYITRDPVAIQSGERCSYGSFLLHDVWCKVLAMNRAEALVKSYSSKHGSKGGGIKAYVYLDSDAIVSTNYSLTDVIGYMRQELSWDLHQRPVAFNQDGPGWACKFTMRVALQKLCLNSGAVIWLAGYRSAGILEDWWHSAGDSYTAHSFPNKWRDRWPWDQATMYDILRRHSSHVQVLSFPEQPFLPWTSTKNPKSQYPTDAIEPWCFSHMPGANCFVSHHCASRNQKNKIVEIYRSLAVNSTSPGPGPDDWLRGDVNYALRDISVLYL